MVLMIVAMLMLPGIDAIGKWLSDSVAPGQIAWSRFFFQSLLMLPLVMYGRRDRMDMTALPIHALRGLLLAVATLCFFTALRFLPLADAIAIFFVEPLLVTLLSPFVLGESVGWRRLSAVLAGFCGALLIIQPGFVAFGGASLLPLISALTFAGYMLLTRRMAPIIPPEQMQFWSGLFGCAALSLALIAGEGLSIAEIDPHWPTAEQWGLLMLLGLIATVGHLLVVYALRYGSIALLAPFQYLEIVSATIFGFWLFGDLPTRITWFGIVIIVGAGLYVFYRERWLDSAGS